MAGRRSISSATLDRLPIYLRAAEQMQRDGHINVASRALAERVGISASNLRKDFSRAGITGKSGSGYLLGSLVAALRRTLRSDRSWPLAIAGAGSLGRALARNQDLRRRGFHVRAIYDVDAGKLGMRINGVTVAHIDNAKCDVAQHGIRLAALTVPVEAADSAAQALTKAGICALLNYVPVTLSVPQHIYVEDIDPVIMLQRLSYYL
ncbi:MAG: redox-sensing transcriptional repressor Rex [Methyloligellaceae bacterium]